MELNKNFVSLVMQNQTEQFYQSYFYRLLCAKITEKANCPVTSFKDSELLAIQMQLSGFPISAHTLARFFGILPRRKSYIATLDILTNYVGYSTFRQFVQVEKESIERGLNESHHLFQIGNYSLIALELAIETNDFPTIEQMIESVDMNHPDKNKISLLLGKKVRESKHQDVLLKSLITVENGRRLFFESYVDEDDANGYFSKALQKYYLHNVSTVNNLLFGYCYLISKGIYNNKPIDHLLPPFKKLVEKSDVNTLHFHELSRLIETQLLIEGNSTRNSSVFLNHNLELCLEFSVKLDNHSFAWLIARPLKAMAHHGILSNALKNELFAEKLINCYQLSTIQTIAELILQFVVHAHFKENELLQFYPPLKLKSDFFQHETNARILIESATAQLYATDSVKTILDKNIYSFAKNTGQTWVFELLN